MKTYIPILIVLISINTLVAQERTQFLNNGNFKVKCGCELKVNSLFIQMVKQSGRNNTIAAYICAENENSPETGVVNNINIFDESASYKDISPSNFSYFDKRSLESMQKISKTLGLNITILPIKVLLH